MLFNKEKKKRFLVKLGDYEFSVMAENEGQAIDVAVASWWDNEDVMPLPVSSCVVKLAN